MYKFLTPGAKRDVMSLLCLSDSLSVCVPVYNLVFLFLVSKCIGLIALRISPKRNRVTFISYHQSVKLTDQSSWFESPYKSDNAPLYHVRITNLFIILFGNRRTKRRTYSCYYYSMATSIKLYSKNQLKTRKKNCK